MNVSRLYLFGSVLHGSVMALHLCVVHVHLDDTMNYIISRTENGYTQRHISG